MKKNSSILLMPLILLIILSACGSPAAQNSVQPASEAPANTQNEAVAPETGGAADFLYCIPGDPPKDVDGGVEAINEKLIADGVGLNLALNFIPWDAWDQKINLML
ncbi:MAG: hypothetical protein LBB94_01650, partial [Clostridiales bacterium]|nr:hypothetical protein [Clostridiales bacterium]